MQVTIQDFYNYYVSKAKHPMSLEQFNIHFPNFWNTVVMNEATSHIPFILPNGNRVWLGMENMIRKVTSKA